jgi:imidazolonepropionase-like amidohydrolase
MILNTLLLVASPLLAPAPAMPDLLAIKVDRAETVSDGTMRHAVILIENGKIAVIGEDLAIERGIPVIDLGPGSVAIPGLINAYSRMGMDSQGATDSRPWQQASAELYPASEIYSDVLEAGVTTLALYPAGTGIPGRAVVVKPHGDSSEEMVLADDAYLKIVLASNSTSKRMITHGFEEADDQIEAEEKARAKWEKAIEKEKKDKKSKKKDDGKESKEVGPYTAPIAKPEAKAFQELRDGDLKALISISTAGDYLHLMDAIGEEEFTWDLRIPVRRNLNMFYVKSELGKLGCRVVMEPSLTLHPNTRRQRNLPSELSEAGAKLVLIPRSDRLADHKDWLHDTGELVSAGLSRDVALRAMTLEPAEMLGVEERMGSLSTGKDANILFFMGDPFETSTKIQAVMLEGEVVFGDLK